MLDVLAAVADGPAPAVTGATTRCRAAVRITTATTTAVVSAAVTTTVAAAVAPVAPVVTVIATAAAAAIMVSAAPWVLAHPAPTAALVVRAGKVASASAHLSAAGNTGRNKPNRW